MEIRSGHAKVGDDLELYYEDLGNPGDPPVLLIMGLGAQLLLWRDGFCERLVEQGYRVIRYDNRDVGLSTKLHGQRPGGALVPNLVRSYLGKPARRCTPWSTWPTTPPRCSITSASSGACGRRFDGRHDRPDLRRPPSRSHRGAGIIFLQQLCVPAAAGTEGAAVADRGPPPGSPRDVIVENSIRVSKIIGSPGYRKSEEQLRAEAIESYERAHYPQGIGGTSPRCWAPAASSTTTTRDQRPTVVIHGRADKLMRPSAAARSPPRSPTRGWCCSTDGP